MVLATTGAARNPRNRDSHRWTRTSILTAGGRDYSCQSNRPVHRTTPLRLRLAAEFASVQAHRWGDDRRGGINFRSSSMSSSTHDGRGRERADALLSGPGERFLLHPRGRQVALRRLHRLLQHAERQSVDRAPPDPGQPPLLGHGNARRWLPLRPRVDPDPRRVGPAAAEPARTVGHRIGSAPGRHQADRRGVGCRRAVPGRQLRRRRLAGVERPLPR